MAGAADFRTSTAASDARQAVIEHASNLPTLGWMRGQRGPFYFDGVGLVWHGLSVALGRQLPDLEHPRREPSRRELEALMPQWGLRQITMDEAGPGDVIILAADSAGRLYAAADAGVYVIDPSGKELGIIPTPRRAITLAFAGPDKHTLYIGAMGAVGPDGKDWQTPKDVRNVAMTIYRVKMLAAGPANKPK